MKSLLRALAMLLPISLPSITGAAGVQVAEFGRMPDGTPVKVFTLRNAHGMVAKVIEYGATVTELHVPDGKGGAVNVTLGFDNLGQYLGRHPSFGATIGRFANRIADARFTLEGREVRVTANSGKNHIHGGARGFGKVVWRGEVGPAEGSAPTVVLHYTAKDGEEGYPGELAVSVTCELNDRNEFSIRYLARTTRPTVINLTNHGYFNLAGRGDILEHELQVFATRYTVPGPGLIPTGEIAPVKGTGLDFTRPAAIGARIREYYEATGGYDHNYVIDGKAGTLRPAARIREPGSGRVMEVLTTEPGVQLYTLNGANTQLTGVGGVDYRRHAGYALETQHYPDSPNHPAFPSTTLKPGETFRSQTVWRFTTGR